MNTVGRVTKNTLVRSIAQGFNMLFSAIFLIYVTRKLGSADFGKYTFAFSLAGLLIVITEMGVHTLLVREIAKKGVGASAVFGTLLLFKLVTTTVFFLLLFLFVFFSNYSDDTCSVLYIMGVFVAGISFLELFNSVFRGFEKMEYEAGAMFLNRVIVVGAGMVALYLGCGLKGFAMVIAASNLATLLPVIIISSRKFIRPKMKTDKNSLKSTLKEAWPIGLMALLTTIMLKSGVVILSIFKDFTATGWYGAPLRLMESLIVFPLFFATALLPVFTSLHHSQKDSLAKWHEGSVSLLVTIGLPVTLGITVLADKLTLLLFGQAYANSSIVLQLLIWATLFTSLNILLSHLLVAIDKEKANVVCYGAGALGTVSLGLILIPLFSYVGAGVSLLFGQILVFASAFSFANKTLSKISILHLSIKPLVSSILMCGLIYYIQQWNIIFVTLLGGFLYLACLLILEGFRLGSIAGITNAVWFKRQN